MRRLQALVLVAALVGAVAASATAGGSAPRATERPNPFLTNLSLDYSKPIPAPEGGAATLAPVEPSAIGASVRDVSYLRYRRDDWGGFADAPLGRLALKDGGAVLLGSPQQPGLQVVELEAGGSVISYLRSHPHSRPAPNPGPPSPPVPQPPLPSPSPVPCANSGFGGTACSGHGGGNGGSGGGSNGPGTGGRGNGGGNKGGGKGGSSGGGGSFGKGACGAAGLSISSDLPHCQIDVAAGAPGEGTYEHLRIKNTSTSRYTLSFKATGTHTPLWDDLELGVWRTGSPPPTPLPPLRFWTTQFTQLVTLDPGQAVRFTIELYLPASVGNAGQHQSAVIGFVWSAVA